MEPKVVLPDEAKTLSLYDVQFRYGIASAETDGRLALLEVTIPPRTLVKPHAHSKEDEFSLVLSGPIGVRVGEQTIEEVPTGSWLAKPRSIPHAMWNVSEEPAKVLEVVSPAGLETYFEKIAPVLREHGPEWTERFYELAQEYGLSVLDDWSDELKATYGIKL
ncbi:MAG TPA: cupin domain-containing protein [Candidatus Binatia bacterium]|nr:cupin domain-containing protein [Candidatus Binatia bacterium]